MRFQHLVRVSILGLLALSVVTACNDAPPHRYVAGDNETFPRLRYEDGDVSARLTGTYDLLLTQRLIAQSRLELNVAAQEVEKFGVGAGVNDIELGLRLRYEIWREFAPYIGVSWLRQLGDTADIARREGEIVDDLALVVGVRVWF